MADESRPRVIAVLGPTNTGKTHYAIERMLGHRTGVIGLPLRLLAREVYDRIVALRGPSVVALVTGEERIVPPRAAWWVATVEAMPTGLGADFLAVDEIQLCADPDRGHIFTDRLLHARGLSETLFLGSDTMRGRIAALVPGVQFLRRERFSKLTHTGARKISRMPPRSAIVGFSAGDVYAIAELIRRQKGGAAVVMGALSPRTRNAQVELYQNGDVDYLVATDAIGMGLNLDIAHVAFSGTVKFDGRRHRHLAPNELAQIAGRAGRFTTDGSFGVTGDAPPLDPGVVEAIEESRFAPLRRLQWRSDRLDFGSAAALIASLEAPPEEPGLARARDADDLLTLRELAERPELSARLAGPADVRLLWDVCQVPDFRKVSEAEHAALCTRLFLFLRDGAVPDDWLAGQVGRIDRTDGDIDTLSTRLAFIRTWTYVAQRRGWVRDAEHWRDETRAVEDRLSDALHARLTQRFVDRRTSVLMRRLKQRERLVASVSDTGEVRVDDQFVGRLEGFRFRLDPSADAAAARTLRAAAVAALAPVISLRADRLYNAPDTEFDVTEQGGLMWGEHAVGKLVPGADMLSPQVEAFVDEEAGPEVAEKLRRRLGHFIDRRITAQFEPLIALRDDAGLSGLSRGVAFRLVEALGALPRAEIAAEVKSLDQESRAGLRRHGVRFGQFTVFMPALLKPGPTRLRLLLWALKEGHDSFPEAPPPGLVTMPAVEDAPKGYYPRAGYRLAGERAIRIDMLERLADMIRPLDARTGFEASADMLSISGLTLEQFASLMQGLGYQARRDERAKIRPPAAPDGASVAVGTAPPDGQAADPPAETEAPMPDAAPAEPAAGAGPASETPVSGIAVAETPAPDPQPGASIGLPDGATEPPEPAQADAATPGAGGAPGSEPETQPGTQSELEPEPEPGTEPEARPAAKPETEVFFVFTRAPRRREGRPVRADGKPGQKPRRRPAKAKEAAAPRKDEAPRRPPRPERRADPDSPFAALAALKLDR